MRELLWAILLLWCPGYLSAVEAPHSNPVKARLIQDNLFSLDFVNENVGWAVGYYGTILHTRDGGITWKRQRSGTAALLKSVDFVDESHGWAVGLRGTIVHTEDGGNRWKAESSGTQVYLRGVQFLDRQRGWVAGELGTLRRTVDGGRSWEDSSLEKKDVRYNALRFVTPEMGWVVGEFGTILHTSDGGRTWKAQRSSSQTTFTSVAFADVTEGYIAGIDGVLLRTENGGARWTEVPSGTRKHLFGVAVPEKGKAIVVGDAEFLVHRGQDLLRSPSGVKVQGLDMRYNWLHEVRFVNPKAGWAVGREGAIIKSSDGGASWKLAIRWQDVREAQ